MSNCQFESDAETSSFYDFVALELSRLIGGPVIVAKFKDVRTTNSIHLPSPLPHHGHHRRRRCPPPHLLVLLAKSIN